MRYPRAHQVSILVHLNVPAISPRASYEGRIVKYRLDPSRLREITNDARHELQRRYTHRGTRRWASRLVALPRDYPAMLAYCPCSRGFLRPTAFR